MIVVDKECPGAFASGFNLEGRMDEETSSPDESFDRHDYDRLPVLDVAGAVGLARSLLAAVPASAPEGVLETAAELRSNADALERDWQQHLLQPGRPDARPVDTRVDRAFGAYIGRIDCYAQLPAARYPKVATAVRALEILVPHGLVVLQAPYVSQHTQLVARLRALDEAGLSAEVEGIAGTEFVTEVRESLELYGEVLGVTAPRVAAPSLPDLHASLRRLASAMDDYVAQVLALVRRGRPATLKTVRDALLPIDEFRRLARQRAGSVSAPVETPEKLPV